MIVAATVPLAALAAPHVAAAAEGYSPWPTRTILYYNGATKYASSVKQAAHLWNRSGVKIRFKAVPKSKARLRIVISNRGLFGGLGFTDVTGTKGTIRLASKIAEASSDPNLSRLLATRVVAHQFGHVLGLGHDNGQCTVMYPHRDETLPPGCRPPKQGWRYRCRVLEAVDVRRAVKIWGGRVRKLARAECDHDASPPAVTSLSLKGNAENQTVDVSWTNAKRLGSTANLQIVVKRSSCPTAAQIERAVAGYPPDDVGVQDPVDPTGPGARQTKQVQTSFAKWCYAVVPVTNYGRPGRAVMDTLDMSVSGPTAAFSHTVSGLTVSFENASETFDGYKPFYEWTFGDGQSSTDTNPSHTYAAPGSYSVRLVVTDQEGQRGETTKNVVVAG